jgi:hypothetical protein
MVPELSAKENCIMGRPFAESWSLKALGEGYMHRVSYLRREGEGYMHRVSFLRRERFLVLSAKSSRAESGYFGSRRRFRLTVKGLFPVV